MKRSTRYLFLALSVVSLILTIGVVCYAEYLDRAETEAEEKTEEKAEEEADEIETIYLDADVLYPAVPLEAPEEPEGETWENTSPESAEEKLSINERLQAVEGLSPEHGTGYIFVGDSRFVNMNDVCDISDRENLFMVAKVGEGYSWFSQTGLKQIKRIVSSGLYDRWKLVICLGINDLGSLDKYLKKYEELKDTYEISLVSVNPITKYGSLSNQQIEEFNEELQKLSFPYIDTYHILMTTGFTTTDGLHYNAETTRKIYSGILLGLQDENSGALSDDEDSVLDKASLGKKNSLQKEILAENRYVKKEPESTAVSANLPPVFPDERMSVPVTEPAAQPPEAPQPAPQEVVNEPMDQELLDYLYGNTGEDSGGDSSDSDDDDDDDDDD